MKETLSAEEWQRHIAATLDAVDFDRIAAAYVGYEFTWWDPQGPRVPSAARIREQVQTMLLFLVNFRQEGDSSAYGGIVATHRGDYLSVEFVLESVDSDDALVEAV